MHTAVVVEYTLCGDINNHASESSYEYNIKYN